jgi:hypothetical protein
MKPSFLLSELEGDPIVHIRSSSVMHHVVFTTICSKIQNLPPKIAKLIRDKFATAGKNLFAFFLN